MCCAPLPAAAGCFWQGLLLGCLPLPLGAHITPSNQQTAGECHPVSHRCCTHRVLTCAAVPDWHSVSYHGAAWSLLVRASMLLRCAVLCCACCAGSHLVCAAPVRLQALCASTSSRFDVAESLISLLRVYQPCSGPALVFRGAADSAWQRIPFTRIKRQVTQAQAAPAVSAHGCGGPWWQRASATAAVSGVHGKYTCVVARRAAHAEGPAHNGHSRCGP